MRCSVATSALFPATSAVFPSDVDEGYERTSVYGGLVLSEEQRESVARIMHTENANNEDAARLHELLLTTQNTGQTEGAFEALLKRNLKIFEQSMLVGHKEALGIDEDSAKRTSDTCDRLQKENARLKRELLRQRRSMKLAQHQQAERGVTVDTSDTFASVLPCGALSNGDDQEPTHSCSIDFPGFVDGPQLVGDVEGESLNRGCGSVNAFAAGSCAAASYAGTREHHSISEEDDSELPEVFRPAPVWRSVEETKDDQHSRPAVATSAENMVSLANFMTEGGGDEQGCWARRFQRLVLPIDSVVFIVWDLICWLILAIECVFTPLTLLKVSDSVLTRSIDWFSRVYWLIDFCISFVKPLETNGGADVEMRVDRIVHTYLKTWFSVDLMLLTLDWCGFVLGDAFGGAKAAGTARVVKLARALRVLRLFRMIRVVATKQAPGSFQGFRLLMNSEIFDVSCQLLMCIIAVLVYHHSIGCLWYAMADIHDGEESWVTNMQISNAGLYETYIYSFHWALGNWQGASDIGAITVEERSLTVMSMIVATFGTTIVVGKMTSAMTRLEILTASQSSKMSALRQFLVENSISMPVAMKIMKNAQARVDEQKRNVPEANVELLSLVSETLLGEMRSDMFLPHMKPHPCFGVLARTNDVDFKQVCCQAVERCHLLSGDILFNGREDTSSAYVTVSGRLCYLSRGRPVEYVTRGDWLCEAVLWTSWTPIGVVLAKREATLLKLSAPGFQGILKCSHQSAEFLQLYAQHFCQALNNIDDGEMTDVNANASVMKDWVDEYNTRQQQLHFFSKKGIALTQNLTWLSSDKTHDLA